MKHMIMVLMMAVCGAVWAQDTIVFQKRASMPSTPRIESAHFVIDSSFFIVGGGDSIGNFYKDVWRYDVVSDSWHQLRDFPGGNISSNGAFSLNGKGYVCSGLDSQVSLNSRVWEYNPDSDSWVQKANFIGPPRQAPTCFSYNSYGYMNSGYASPGNDLWKYSFALDQWTEMDTLPSDGRYGSSFAIVDSFAYLIGGHYSYRYGHATSEVWRYNLTLGQWQRVSDIPGPPRGFGTSWSFDNYIIAGMGSYFDSSGITVPI